MPATWELILGTGDFLTERAQGVRMSFARNGVPECQLTLAHTDSACRVLLTQLASQAVPSGYGLLPVLRGYRTDRQGLKALRFVGYLAGITEDAGVDGGLATFTFRGPFGRILGDGSNRGAVLSATATYSAQDAGVIAWDLMTKVAGSTGIVQGPIQATKRRDRTYLPGQRIGDAVVNLTNVLDGFDFEVTPFEPRTLLPPSFVNVSNLAGNNPVGGTNTATYTVTALDGLGETTGTVRTVRDDVGDNTLRWAEVEGAVSYNIYVQRVQGGSLVTEHGLMARTTATAFVDDHEPVLDPNAGEPSVNTTGGLSYDGFGPPPQPRPRTDLSGVLGVFRVFGSQGDEHPEAKFEYGPDTMANCSDVHRETLPPINRVTLVGNGIQSLKEDAASQARWGVFEYSANLSDISIQATLDDRAFALLRPNFVKTIDFTPEVRLSPWPWDDYWLGDTVPLLARADALQENALLRINAINIVLDENGFESVEVPDPTTPDEEAMIRASLSTEVVT